MHYWTSEAIVFLYLLKLSLFKHTPEHEIGVFFYNTDVSISYIVRQGIKLKIRKFWQERDIKSLYKHWYSLLKNAYNIFISSEKNIYIIFNVLSKHNRSDKKKKKEKLGLAVLHET